MKIKINDTQIPLKKVYRNKLFFSSSVFNIAPYLNKLWCNPKPPIGIINRIMLYAKRTIPSSLFGINCSAIQEAIKDKILEIIDADKM